MLHTKAGEPVTMLHDHHTRRRVRQEAPQRNLWNDPDHREIRGDLQEFLLDVLVAT